MVQLNGVWTDLIDEFMAYTENAPSPEIFRLWSAISMVSGALERRVWTLTGQDRNYTNLYVLLVGTPGTGKGIIREVKALWRDTKEPSGGEAFTISSNSTTKAALVDQLAKAEKVRLTLNGPNIYHSLLVPAEEFEVLLPHYDPEFIGFLDEIWNNDPSWREDRRHGPAKVVEITNPFMHILGGVQPAWFVSHFPETAWDTGFARRIVMIYADSAPRRDPFRVNPQKEAIKEHILQRLGHLSNLYGHVLWEAEAVEEAKAWYNGGEKPVPTHTKLVHYVNSRWQLVIKLTMTAAVSRTGALGPIIKADFLKALGWLLEAESKMEDVFRSMLGKSDSAIIEELHHFVNAYWERHGKEGVQDIVLTRFLMTRVPSDRIDKIIQTASNAGYIVKSPGSDRWLPRAKEFVLYH